LPNWETLTTKSLRKSWFKKDCAKRSSISVEAPSRLDQVTEGDAPSKRLEGQPVVKGAGPGLNALGQQKPLWEEEKRGSIVLTEKT